MSKESSVFFYRLLAALKGPLIMYLIVKYLTDIQQGEWFLFTSLGAITTLIDLGFGTMISNFIANASGSNSKRELHFLVGYTQRIYFILMLIGGLLMTVIGYFSIASNLFIPYALYILANTLLLFASGKIVILMGLNKVFEVHRAMSAGLVCSTVALFIMISLGFALVALVASIYVQAIVVILSLRNQHKFKPEVHFSELNSEFKFYKNRILNVYGKYALSWLSGFLIFNAYVPVISAKSGVVEAGKIGLLLAMFAASMNLALTWSHSTSPKLANLIAKNEFRKAFNLWRNALIKGYAFFVVLIILIFSFYVIELPFLEIRQKLPEINVALCLSIIFLVRIYGSFSATWIRAQRMEKHTVINVISGILIFSTLYFSEYSNIAMPFILISLYSLVILIPVYFFIVKRNVKRLIVN